MKQAEAQGALVAGTVTEVQAGRAVLAPLHPDEGLDLGAHLELHYGLDQWPVGTTAVDSTLSPGLPLSNLVVLAAGCSSLNCGSRL